MYTLAVRREFTAQHYLIGGDWGAENQLHSHKYLLELQMEGSKLNQHGYLVDIVDVEHHLDDLLADYRNRTLNELPGFSGLNPSLEHFACILANALKQRITDENINSMRVILWENDFAWAAYHVER